MKLTRLNELCRELFDAYGCDPGSLYLTAASRRELSEDVLAEKSICDMGITDADDGAVGARISSGANVATGTRIYIDASEVDRDYFLTRIYV